MSSCARWGRRITAEVLAQDSKDIPLPEEYVLRLVDQGERSCGAVPEAVVERQAMACCRRRGHRERLSM